MHGPFLGGVTVRLPEVHTMSDCTYIGGLGELVRFIRPPVIGRSASFRLRFRFVRAVRAVRGEAKLCGRMWDVVLIAGPPGCWDRRVCVSVPVRLASIFCAPARGF